MAGKKKQHHEEHVDETWLLPYSDMLTLLLALFIVMFAMSQVDNKKLAEVSQQFNVIFSGGNGVLTQSSGSNGNTIKVSDTVQENSAQNMNGIVEQDKMVQMKKALEQDIKDSGYQDKINVGLGPEGLTITILDSALFNSGEADVLQSFNPLLLEISKMVKDLGNEIRITGHTDNVPIKTSKFRSNWDLSYMRASNVMDFMVNQGQVTQDKFSIEADGEYRPKYDNSTEDGRAKNRSVDILVVRKYTYNDGSKTDSSKSSSTSTSTSTTSTSTSNSQSTSSNQNTNYFDPTIVNTDEANKIISNSNAH